jgi:AbrB family looped-hinge helix DNA binding protein
MPAKDLLVEVGRYGRLVLPKTLREKYGVDEGTKLLISGIDDRIELVPVRTYDRPTEALYGRIRVDKPVDEPKKAARKHIKSRLSGEFE